MDFRYNPKETEPHWQQQWEEASVFSAGSDAKKPAYYVLEMFPYPSGRLHMGHLRNYAIGDVLARYKKAQGYDVLHPMGWDAFGLPAENAAIQNNTHPADWTYNNIEQMREKLKTIGLSYDWEREIATCDPEYYRIEQAMFLDFYKHDLVYRKDATVNWDPVDHTVLANEQVIDGRGWRSGALVERKNLSQWFLKITSYADRLLQGLEGLNDWPEPVRLMQSKWIGRSEGCRIQFDVEGTTETLEVYTTRPETLFGASFCAIAADHPLALKAAENNPELSSFLEKCRKGATNEAAIETAEKEGMDTGLRVKHPVKAGETLPVWVSNYVLMDYGTGALFGCPAHDQRDIEFAQKYDLPIITVVAPEDEPTLIVTTEPYVANGIMVNSELLNGMSADDAKPAMIDHLESLGCGSREINFRLRDWGVSRQRYWGCPIPMIHCPDCGVVPVPKEDLPVTLPEDVSFDEPGNPLSNHPSWKHVDCPKCGGKAQRETDTFDTFFESSWYFARFASPNTLDSLDKDACDRWLSVDAYIGGIEHAILHLLYARFFTYALHDLGYVSIEEPFKQLLTQGMVTHETLKDADGAWVFPHEVIKNREGEWVHETSRQPVTRGRIEKMSKSKKNVVEPDHIIAVYGADTARLFMLSDSPPERDLEWTEGGIDGAWRYVNKLWRLTVERGEIARPFKATPPTFSDDVNDASAQLRKETHKAITMVAKDIERFHLNKAVARIREFSNAISQTDMEPSANHPAIAEAMQVLAHLINPFMPHLAEAMWHELGGRDLLASRDWPVCDESLLVEDTITMAVQINGKTRATIQLPTDAKQDQAEKIAMEEAGVQRALDGKTIRKTIYVPGRILNVVAS